MNEAHIICPRCGCEIEVGNESGLRMVTPPTPGVHVLKAKENGLDFSKFVAATDPAQRAYEKVSTPSNIDNGVVESIKENGYIKNSKHRRFVTAQMFRMLQHENGYTGALNELPYAYQWAMLCGDQHYASELRTIAHLQKVDKLELKRRTVFFNVYTVIDMLDDFIYKANMATVKGRYYTERCERTVNDAKVLRNWLWGVRELPNYSDINMKVSSWYHRNSTTIKYVSRTCGFKKSESWKDAFRGSGAYYTMQNLLCYHGCKLITELGCLEGELAVKYIDLLMHGNRYKPGYEWLGMLKEMIEYNRFAPDWD